MESETNKADVESRLQQTAEDMSDRMASIQDEVSSTGVSIRDWIVRNPGKSVGGTLAMGLAVGLLFGGSRSNRGTQHTELLDAYLEALRQEVEEAVEQGDEPGPALEEALRGRTPLVVFNQKEQERRRASSLGRTLLREGMEILFSTGMGLLAREVIESLLANLDVESIVEDGVRE